MSRAISGRERVLAPVAASAAPGRTTSPTCCLSLPPKPPSSSNAWPRPTPNPSWDGRGKRRGILNRCAAESSERLRPVPPQCGTQCRARQGLVLNPRSGASRPPHRRPRSNRHLDPPVSPYAFRVLRRDARRAALRISPYLVWYRIHDELQVIHSIFVLFISHHIHPSATQSPF